MVAQLERYLHHSDLHDHMKTYLRHLSGLVSGQHHMVHCGLRNGERSILDHPLIGVEQVSLHHVA